MPPSVSKETTKTLVEDIRVGELYWKQDGSYNWMLGQLVAVNSSKKTANFRLVNEVTGEIVQESQVPIQENINLCDVHLLPANPLFSYVIISLVSSPLDTLSHDTERKQT